MTARLGGRRAAPLGVAAGGVLLGHWIAYVAVAPTGHVRRATLEHTGHGYLALANDVGLVLALGALAALFLRRLTERGSGLPDVAPLAARLCAFQAGAFAAMEVLERASSGAPLAGLFDRGLLPVGLVAQVAVACLGALAIRRLLRAADRVAELGEAAAPPAPAEVVLLPTPGLLARRPRPAWTGPGLRAPPPAV